MIQPPARPNRSSTSVFAGSVAGSLGWGGHPARTFAAGPSGDDCQLRGLKDDGGITMRFRFRLRTLMLLVLAVSLFFAGLMAWWAAPQPSGPGRLVMTKTGVMLLKPPRTANDHWRDLACRTPTTERIMSALGPDS